jgi:hypothetical protein
MGLQFWNILHEIYFCFQFALKRIHHFWSFNAYSNATRLFSYVYEINISQLWFPCFKYLQQCVHLCSYLTFCIHSMVWFKEYQVTHSHGFILDRNTVPELMRENTKNAKYKECVLLHHIVIKLCWSCWGWRNKMCLDFWTGNFVWRSPNLIPVRGKPLISVLTVYKIMQSDLSVLKVWHRSEFLEIKRANNRHVLCSQDDDYEDFKTLIFSEIEDMEAELNKVSK